MGKKITYNCDICRDPKLENELYGCVFKDLHNFKLGSARNTDGVHICFNCIRILKAELAVLEI